MNAGIDKVTVITEQMHQQRRQQQKEDVAELELDWILQTNQTQQCSGATYGIDKLGNVGGNLIVSLAPIDR